MGAPRIIGVLGAKGGCGTTLITANLAGSLVSGQRVCAMDLDFGKGDLAGLLDLTPVLSVPELLACQMDPTLLRGSAARHRSGLAVLGQPKDMTLLVRPNPDELHRLLTEAREAWDLVFVDLGSRVDDTVIATVREMDRLILVASDNLLALRDAVRVRALLHHAEVPSERQWLVVNHLRRHPPMPDAELEETLHLHVDAVLPTDAAACDAAILEGALLWESTPGSPLGHALYTLWNQLLEGPVPAPRWHLPWVGGVR